MEKEMENEICLVGPDRGLGKQNFPFSSLMSRYLSVMVA